MTEETLSDKLHGTEEGYNNIREEDVRECLQRIFQRMEKDIEDGCWIKYAHAVAIIKQEAGEKLT